MRAPATDETVTATGRSNVCAKETCPKMPIEERTAMAKAQAGEVSRVARSDPAVNASWAFRTRGSLSAFSPGKRKKAKICFRDLFSPRQYPGAVLKFY